MRSGISGALAVIKPEGLSSFDVIRRLQRKDGPTLGHAGTLDPFASGVLVLLVGKAVQVAQFFLKTSKVYRGVGVLGHRTPSGDRMLPVCESLPESSWPEAGRLREVAQQWVARREYWQVPPLFSAKHFQGKRLYELARQGVSECPLPPERREIFACEVEKVDFPEVTFRVEVSSGTYVRTFFEDWAKACGTLGYLKTLERLAVGNWHSPEAISLKDLQELSLEQWPTLSAWRPFDQLWQGLLPACIVTQAQANALACGQQQFLDEFLKSQQCLPPAVALIQEPKDQAGKPPLWVAWARQESERWELSRVFISPTSAFQSPLSNEV